MAAGPASLAQVLGGTFNVALAVGATGGENYAQADAGYDNSDFANLAVTLGNNSYAFAGGLTPLAGSIFQKGATVTKATFGVNINGLRVPDTAAAVDVPQPAAARRGPARPASPAATSRPSTAKAVSPAAAVRGKSASRD